MKQPEVLGRCPRCGYAVVDVARACPECGTGAAALASAVREQQTGFPYRPWLHRFALAFVVATFVLLVLGGTVTSKGVGLAVPDWPTTFEYNMFLFPPSMWVGGIFWEHTHRLMGSLVGLMAIVMCVWLWQTNRSFDDLDSPRTPVRGRPWLRWLGVATLVLVIIQGIMGGLRVTQLSTTWAVIHGITAQVFLCMTVLIAAATSRWWIETGNRARETGDAIQAAAGRASIPPSVGLQRLQKVCALALIALFIQLALGATVRHHGAGLAIPDFPLSYGKLVPPLTQGEIEQAMIAYADEPDEYATTQHGWYTPLHVGLHWAHRLWAIAAVAAVATVIVRTVRVARDEAKLRRPAIALGVMIVMQVALGASVIWTGRHPEVATAHQTLGAVLLATAALVFYRIRVINWHGRRAQGGLPVACVEGDPSRANRSEQRPARATPNGILAASGVHAAPSLQGGGA